MVLISVLSLIFVSILFTVCVICTDSFDSITFFTHSISVMLFLPKHTCSNMYIVPSPSEATMLPAMTAFNRLAPILIPGIAFIALIAAFAAVAVFQVNAVLVILVGVLVGVLRAASRKSQGDANDLP